MSNEALNQLLEDLQAKSGEAFMEISDALINLKCIFPLLWGQIRDYEKAKDSAILDSYEDELKNYQDNYVQIQKDSKWVQKDLFFLVSNLNQKIKQHPAAKASMEDTLKNLTELKNQSRTFIMEYLPKLQDLMHFLEKKPQLILANKEHPYQDLKETYDTQLDLAIKHVKKISQAIRNLN